MASVTIGPCPGCCGGIPCVIGSLSCLTKGGTASLCGFAEYVSPSVPPKFYRNETLSGSLIGCDGVNCGYPPTTDAEGFGFQWGGTYLFNAMTCGQTNGEFEKFVPGIPPPFPGNCSLGPAGPPTLMIPPFTPSWISNDVGRPGFTNPKTPTQNQFIAAAACNTGNQYGNGIAQADLSDEDLETDALNRLLDSQPWAPCSGSFGPCCLAQWEARTSGNAFAYQDALFTLVASGLIPGQEYRLPVEFYDRPFGLGSYTLLERVFFRETADNFGIISVSDFVPNQRGYQTYAVAGDCPPPT